MSATQTMNVVCRWVLFGLLFSCALSTALPFHKHRRHVNRRLYLNNYFASVDGSIERGALIQHKDIRDMSMMRNKMRSLNLINPNLLMLPEKTAQFKNGDARFYRINALASREGKLRSTPFNDNSMSTTMKKILLRMN